MLPSGLARRGYGQFVHIVTVFMLSLFSLRIPPVIAAMSNALRITLVEIDDK